MKLLCLALLVLAGHQALANPRRVKQQPVILNPVPVENLKVNLGMTTGKPEATTGNLEVTTRKPWVIEPRHERIAPRAYPYTDHNKPNHQEEKVVDTVIRESRQGCKEGEFQCDTDFCISEVKRCDGRVNCADGTDEDECYQEEKVVDTVIRESRQEICPSPFRLRGNECFFVHEDQNEALNWDESRQRCLSMGGDLAQPQNMVDFVNYIKEDYSNSKSTIWLGATDKDVEGQWKWLSGESVPPAMWEPWPHNQPSGDGNCMEIHYWSNTDFYMNDWYCHMKGHYACEIEPGCGSVFSHSSGTIVYPIGGGNYQNDADCVWVINAGTPIQIKFTSFQVENRYDFLQIRDGESSGSSELGKLTGHNLPEPVETSGNAAYLQFTSDYSVTFSGFELHWAPSGCGAVHTTSNGVIRHPLNGGNYENNEDCIWKINAAEPIKITIVRLDLEINYDFLYVRNGPSSDSPLLGSFSGPTIPNPVDTTQNSAFIRFSSDYSVTKTGFELRWEPASTTGSSDCVCGTTNRGSRIVGGVTTEVNEYPWQVALVRQGGSGVFCGGSLINDRWVLTAAHCTQSGVSQVLLGNHLQSQTDDAERRINVRRVVDHPSYNDQTIENDFSLLELSTPVDLENVDPEIRPVCLPSASNPSQYEGVPTIVSGWGTTSSGGSQPDALREATVMTMSNAVCNQDYGGAILNSMICAANSNPARDACQGDSGGPLVRNVGGYFNQIGVVSWGSGCADPNYPGVYSRVTDAISWITSTSSSGSTCAPPS